MGKTVCLWLPLACLVGFVVGSWGARDELRAFKEHVSEEKTKAHAKKQDGFETFARMVKIPEAAKRPRMVMMMVTMERGHDDLKRRRLFWNLPDGVSFDLVFNAS